MKQSRIEKALFALFVVGALFACKQFSGGDDEESSSEESASEESSSSSGDKVGVEVCDEFLEKYEKCVSDSTKIPTEAKESYKEAIKNMRESWKQAASTPGGKAGLKMGCEQSLESTKKAMEQFDCEW